MASAPFNHDVIVIGAGPAGCSAASWAAQSGLRVAVVDRAAGACATLRPLTFETDSVLGMPGLSLSSLAQRIEGHVVCLTGIDWFWQHDVNRLERTPGRWHVHAGQREPLHAPVLIVATGVRPRRPQRYFGDGPSPVMDAIGLTSRREGLAPGKVLLLGGGDNAVENALYLAKRQHAVTVWSRSPWNAQPGLLGAMLAHPGIERRVAVQLPASLQPLPDSRIEAVSSSHGREVFDAVAVLFGYEPTPEPWHWVAAALGLNRSRVPSLDWPQHGVLVAGDASGRWPPCVQTAMADGVLAARQALALFEPGVVRSTAGESPQLIEGNLT